MNAAALTLAAIVHLLAVPEEDTDRIAIPTIDLSAEVERRVIVDREPGQYLGHPTTVLLEDAQTILCVYPKGHGRGAIVFKRSRDGGKTWSERLPVPENWATSLETPTIHRTVDGAGKKRLVVFSGLYPIRRALSEDDGRTWTPLEPIGEFGGIVAMSSVVRVKDGSYVALFHDDGRFLTNDGAKDGKPGAFTVFQSHSSDGGVTWGAPRAIATHSTAHLCEPGAVRSPDGRRLAALLRENSRRQRSFVILSDDEAESWSQPREVALALTGDRHVGRYAPDGRLAVTFRDMAPAATSATRGDFCAWVGTWDDVVMSREGQYRVRLLDNKGPPSDTGYAGLELLPDGTFVATTYCGLEEGEKPVVVSVRFRLEEIDARARAATLPK